jgi:hypothetical protein
MSAVYKDHDRFRGQAKRLAAHIEREFATDKIYEQFIDSILPQNEQQLMKEMQEMLDKLSV